jgi:hypothetical protein
MLALGALGAYHLQGRAAFPVDVVLATGAGLSTAVIEELIFRGYVFRWIARRSAPLALAVTSLFFGLIHWFNPHATIFSSIAIALEAGLLLGAAYWISGNLWFPIGIHFGWNFTEGTIFNVPVSGTESPGLILGTLRGPNWLTGGEFGIESSVVAVAICTLAGVAMLLLCLRQGAEPVR